MFVLRSTHQKLQKELSRVKAENEALHIRFIKALDLIPKPAPYLWIEDAEEILREIANSNFEIPEDRRGIRGEGKTPSDVWAEFDQWSLRDQEACLKARGIEKDLTTPPSPPIPRASREV